MMLNRLVVLIICFGAFCLSTAAQVDSPENSTKETPKERKLNVRPEPARDLERFDKVSKSELNETCVLLTTSEGDIFIEFFPEFAPKTIRNFLNLVDQKIFDTTTFSRIVPGFIIQGGSISTRSERTPEMTERARRKIPDEPNAVKHERGIISMARGDEPNSASSNFFILLSEAPHLDGSFAAFGRVIAGMDIVEKINAAPVDGEKPKIPVMLREAVIRPCSEVRKIPENDQKDNVDRSSN